MDLHAQLEALREHAHTLEDTIEDIDRQMEKAMHAVAAGTFDVGHALEVLRSRQNDHAGFTFELGKVTARIEDLENRIQEQSERERENGTVERWEERAPVVEDRLDWLRPVLDAPEPEREAPQDERHPRHEGEERMLEDMHRENGEPEDRLDWWKR